MWRLVQILSAVLLNHLPGKMSMKAAEDGPSATHVEDPDGVPDSWLQPDSALSPVQQLTGWTNGWKTGVSPYLSFKQHTKLLKNERTYTYTMGLPQITWDNSTTHTNRILGSVRCYYSTQVLLLKYDQSATVARKVKQLTLRRETMRGGIKPILRQ